MIFFLPLILCTPPNPQPQSRIDFIFRICYGSSSLAINVLCWTSLFLTNKLTSDKRKVSAQFMRLVSIVKIDFSMWRRRNTYSLNVESICSSCESSCSLKGRKRWSDQICAKSSTISFYFLQQLLVKLDSGSLMSNQ